MIRTQPFLFVPGMLCIVLAGSGFARAQHLDVLVQQMDGQLVTGSADFDHSDWELGSRVWFRDFDEDYAINNPGFNALGSGAPNLPPGSQALPGDAALSWDFMPMTIDDVWQNLFYWDGLESDGMPGLTPDDVVFGPPPGPNYTLSLFDKDNAKHSVDGADAVVPGGVIAETDAEGYLHQHRYFFLEDGDGNAGTDPADGIYLLAMRLKMEDLNDSLPIYMVFGTPGSSVAALDDAAVPWVEQRVDELTPIPRLGDMDGDYDVDTDDVGPFVLALTNRAAYEAQFPGVEADLAGDTNQNGIFDFGDIASFQGLVTASVGSALQPTLSAAATPEPDTLALIVTGLLAVVFQRSKSPNLSGK